MRCSYRSCQEISGPMVILKDGASYHQRCASIITSTIPWRSDFNGNEYNDDEQHPLNQPQQNNNRFIIFCKDLSNRNFPLRGTRDMLVRDFKIKVNAKTGVPASDQRLIYEGKQLEDGNNLGFYNLKNNSTVHLTLRLRGGNQK